MGDWRFRTGRSHKRQCGGHGCQSCLVRMSRSSSLFAGAGGGLLTGRPSERIGWPYSVRGMPHVPLRVFLSICNAIRRHSHVQRNSHSAKAIRIGPKRSRLSSVPKSHSNRRTMRDLSKVVLVRKHIVTVLWHRIRAQPTGKRRILSITLMIRFFNRFSNRSVVIDSFPAGDTKRFFLSARDLRNARLHPGEIADDAASVFVDIRDFVIHLQTALGGTLRDERWVGTRTSRPNPTSREIRRSISAYQFSSRTPLPSGTLPGFSRLASRPRYRIYRRDFVYLANTNTSLSGHCFTLE